ncbi:fibronectin type III domain-containing protein [Sediminibacterium sp.]|uniref:fibronectin type III domain-containing protein n=1 Tax=Sediminibacterium sp. TaxID=1917865 RepID=UPI002726C1E7|nr:fibronectin type III domain-containing protein [Sediminibacterium sp.]MDO9000362.1 fibronectin type III domain-containing protein [Bacteroidota bacterium]MDP3147069.1 fibronectin type III domain-containing protein [Bacteroidota bacterium]MDP3567395.1 fibronectin type III domain-containing protein [Sediminibacterium sp.]
MKKIAFILILLIGFIFLMKSQEKVQLHARHFIKKNKIIFRIVPDDKKVFELIKTNGLSITRYNLTNSGITNSVVVNDFLHPYWEADTLNWMRLIRQDKNKIGFVYNALHKNKADSKLPVQKRESQEEMVYSLMLLSCDFDSEIAKACGLYFVDSTIINSEKYVYQIAVYTSSTSLAMRKLLTINIDPLILSTNKQIVGLSGRGKNKITTLKWKVVDYKDNFSGYNVERSEDSLNFQKINNSPVILFSSQFEKNKEYVFYSDTMPQTNKKYFYRIKGINFFGEESEPSNIVANYSAPIINSNPLIDTIVVLENKKVKVKWRMENNAETNSVKNYVLLRSEKDNGVYKKMFESNTILNFVDLNPSSSNFYKVGAITFNNDTVFSFSRMATIIDTIAPSAPINLKAIVDKTGNVSISWSKGKESDLQGYKLFKANSLNEEFVQINSKFITDTFYHDKLNLNTLSKNIYYTLAATDENFNSSITSSPIEVMRPDTVPPSAPILKSLFPEIKGIKLSFILSNSDDVEKHTISRKTKEQSSFENMYEFYTKDSLSFFIDTTVSCGNNYTYKISAYDKNNNFSVSKNLTLQYETGFRKKLTGVNYTVDRTLKAISLNWEYNEYEIEKFILYRKKENETLTILKTINGTTTFYVDNTPNIGNIYEYRIKAVLYNGAESIISDPIKVVY